MKTFLSLEDWTAIGVLPNKSPGWVSSKVLLKGTFAVINYHEPSDFSEVVEYLAINNYGSAEELIREEIVGNYKRSPQFKNIDELEEFIEAQVNQEVSEKIPPYINLSPGAVTEIGFIIPEEEDGDEIGIYWDRDNPSMTLTVTWWCYRPEFTKKYQSDENWYAGNSVSHIVTFFDSVEEMLQSTFTDPRVRVSEQFNDMDELLKFIHK